MKWTGVRDGVIRRIVAAAAVAAMLSITAAMAQTADSVPGQEVQPAAPAKPAPGSTILSDTMGVDFSGYMRRLQHDIQRNWDPLIPKKAQSPENKKGVTGIRFTILPDGKIGSMKLETQSGDVDLDKAAWYAITSEGKFPPLPAEFHGPRLELRMGFFYNTPQP